MHVIKHGTSWPPRWCRAACWVYRWRHHLQAARRTTRSAACSAQLSCAEDVPSARCHSSSLSLTSMRMHAMSAMCSRLGGRGDAPLSLIGTYILILIQVGMVVRWRHSVPPMQCHYLVMMVRVRPRGETSRRSGAKNAGVGGGADADLHARTCACECVQCAHSCVGSTSSTHGTVCGPVAFCSSSGAQNCAAKQDSEHVWHDAAGAAGEQLVHAGMPQA